MPETNVIVVYVVMFALLGLMWNNGRKRKKAALELQSSLAVGAEVMIGAGIYGTVSSVADDKVTIKSGTSTLVVARGAIVRVISAPVAAEAAPTKAAKATKTEK